MENGHKKREKLKTHKNGSVNRSLAKQVMQMVCTVYFLSVLLISFCNFLVARSIMRSDVEDLLYQQINYYESEVDRWISVRQEHLNILKHDIENRTLEELSNETLLEILSKSTNYGSAQGVISDYVVLPNDVMISGDGWVPDPDYKPTQNDYYKEPAASGETYFSTPYIDAHTGEFIITISMPLHVNGQLFGVLCRDLYINEVQDITKNYHSDEGIYLYLLDNEKNILSHISSDFAPSGNDVHHVSEMEDMEFLGALPDSEVYRGKDYDGDAKCFIEKTNAATGWVIGLSYPQKINNMRLAMQILISTALAIISILFTMWLLMPFLRRCLQPIQIVVDAAKQIEQGNLQINYSVDSENEIGDLAESFQQTTSYLESVIRDISRILNQIANGDLDVKPQCEYRGDFGQIETAIQFISSMLNEMIGGIRNAADQVAHSSEQVAQNAQMLSRSAQNQVVQVEALVQNCDQASQNVTDNADKCRKAGGITTAVSEKLEVSNQQMARMTDAMIHINESSNKINEVNKTIENIAFRTNILALNASVEAARAGAAGQGFAVVADQVRNLAAQSAEAAKSTTQLIGHSIQMVDNGTEISDSTAESLQEAVAIAQQVYQTIQEIVLLSKGQAEEINQISDGMKGISGLIQANSETAEESAAASMELSGQAQAMRELVSHFRTK